MTEIIPEKHDDIETADNTWVVKTIAIGTGLGALVGAFSAYLLVQRSKRTNINHIKISSGEGLRLGLLLLGLLRNIATLGDE